MLNFISNASSLTVAGLAFGWIFGCAILGFVAQSFMPEHHFSADSKDAARIGAGLVATLAALILGLLISSTKGTFDQVNGMMNQVGADYIHLDRLLANHGDDTAPIRRELRKTLEAKLQEIWPEESGNNASAQDVKQPDFQKIAAEISALKVNEATQVIQQSDSEKLLDDLLHEQGLVAVTGEGSVPPLLLVIPVIWVSFLTFLYALFSPRNFTVASVLFVCSISIAGAIFLIDEMAGPLGGLIKVPSAPLRYALEQISR